MEQLITQIYAALREKLEKIETGKGSRLQKAIGCFDTVADALSILEPQLDPTLLSAIPDQIRFYRDVFPAYLTEVIYYRKLRGIETERPGGRDEAALRTYYKAQEALVKAYLDSHDFLESYLHGGKTYLDEIMFTLSQDSLPVYPRTQAYARGEFFNFHSFLLAKIMAYRKLKRLLRRIIRTADFFPVSLQHFDLPFLPTDRFEKHKIILERKMDWMEQKVDAEAFSLFESHWHALRQNRKRKTTMLALLYNKARIDQTK